jgi:hypothetical protein
MGSREIAMVVTQNTTPPPIVSMNSFFERMVEPFLTFDFLLVMCCVRFIRSIPRAKHGVERGGG